MKERAIVEVDLSTIRKNIEKIKRYTNKKIMAILKADAYGMGSLNIAKFIQKSVDYIGVATPEEGIILRKKGISIPIVLLGYFDKSEINSLIDYNIIITVYSEIKLKELLNIMDKNIKIFVAIDTGMKRLGVNYDDNDLVESVIKSGLNCEGVISHYASSSTDYDFTLCQQDRFDKAVYDIDNDLILRSVANTDGIIMPNKYDLVRIGIGMYGGGAFPFVCDLYNAIRVIAKIAQIKIVNNGESIGYDRKYFAQKDIKIAIITLGYADGLMQNFSSKGLILYHNKKCPIVGKICMDYCMADISEVPDASVDDEVLLFGQELDYAYLAKIGISPYEFLCGIGNRVKRIYKK